MQDARLDQWVDAKLLRRATKRRFGAPGYTRYTNKALIMLSDVEIPFVLRRREDLKYELQIYGHTDIADGWDDLGLTVCRLLFRSIEGTDWPHAPEAL
ncbi:MAG TPA: hypothetical protein VE954_43385 [Oligoflexus sp.]|uniref:hypothetical protein n=1 Tax=Oligoflexus sp. TaxID=1971216 RepID=UPI002D5ABED8|nr:hypothetical protein [Oligoflexus sp.]HYX39989.1 hypothetical protein [Oligoflexus sp.]